MHPLKTKFKKQLKDGKQYDQKSFLKFELFYTLK